MKIALAGNPNSGKTTLYNAITGKNETVGNWAGVTVSKKMADIKKKYEVKGEEVTVVDLPGAYSISPYTSEEAITRDFVLDEKPDVIINIVDGANISRSLFFTTQLMDLGIPVVIALNKNDIVNKRGDKVDAKALSIALNCEVVPTTATTEEGLAELIKTAVKRGNNKKSQVVSEFKGKGTDNEDTERQKYVDTVVKKSLVKTRDAHKVSFSDKIDRIVANKYLGIPIFFAVMWGVFWFSIEGLGGFLSGYFNDTFFGEIVPNAANSFLEGMGVNPTLQALIVDGAIGGVGAVIGFLPLIMVLFFCLSLLEDCGYMARVAVVMDRFFKKIGLSGKSIIPMIVGSGCAIPGVMATRTIEDVNEKRMTTILTPFVPCGAKLPVIALFGAVFFKDAAWVSPLIYIISIVMIIICGLVLKKIFVWENTSFFILELPEYKVPSLKYAVLQMMNKAKGFIYKAATIILVCNTLVWFMQNYSWSMSAVADSDASILASVGKVIAPLLLPLGFAMWQMAAASIVGFIAKENVVATLAVILAVATEEALHMPGGVLGGMLTPVTAFAFLGFNLFTPPCFAAMGAMNSEMGSKKWLFKAIGFQLAVGYLFAMFVNQIGTPLFYGHLAQGWQIALVITAVLVVYLVHVTKKAKIKERELGVEV